MIGVSIALTCNGCDWLFLLKSADDLEEAARDFFRHLPSCPRTEQEGA